MAIKHDGPWKKGTSLEDRKRDPKIVPEDGIKFEMTAQDQEYSDRSNKGYS